MREAQAAARLNHPGIVTLYEIGEERGNALLVTELVEGSTLARLAAESATSQRPRDRRDRRRSAARPWTTPMPAASSIATSSRRTCSVRPTSRAAARQADGLRRRPRSPAPPPDRTRRMVGTLAYMAPEQAEGRKAGPEADVYSLALTSTRAGAARTRTGGATRRDGARDRLPAALPPTLRPTCRASSRRRRRRPAGEAPRRPRLDELGTAIEDSLTSSPTGPRGAAPPSGHGRGRRCRRGAWRMARDRPRAFLP